MRKSMLSAIVASVLFVPSGAGAVAIHGDDVASCAPGAKGPAVIVRVRGFKDGDGNVRVQLYSDDADTFLEKGSKLKRVEAPSAGTDPMSLCMPVPGPGRYVIAVLHDRNANGRFNATKDGAGFSRNPDLGWGKPSLDEVVFTAAPGVTTMDVVLNYVQGLSVKPMPYARD